jgi:Zn-dependent alcohol dehydrogenase
MTQLEIKGFREIGDYGDRKICALVATDQSGGIHVANFLFKTIYAEQINKSFRRMMKRE